MRRFAGIGPLLLLAVLGVFTTTSVQASDWYSDYHVAKDASIAAGTRLLVVLEDPTKPQHSIEQVSTMTSSVELELLKPFTTCRIDVSTEKGKDLAGKFGATEYPYTAVIEKTGKWIVYSNQGRFTNSEWVSMLVEQSQERSSTRTASSGANCFT